MHVSKEMINEFWKVLVNTSSDESFDVILDQIKQLARTNIHPEIEFI